MTLDRALTVKNLEQTKKGLAGQHATLLAQDEKIEALEATNAGLKIESLNGQEIISQLTDANVKPADPDEAGGDDNPCRRSDCVKLAAELDEARNRF